MINQTYHFNNIILSNMFWKDIELYKTIQLMLSWIYFTNSVLNEKTDAAQTPLPPHPPTQISICCAYNIKALYDLDTRKGCIYMVVLQAKYSKNFCIIYMDERKCAVYERIFYYKRMSFLLYANVFGIIFEHPCCLTNIIFQQHKGPEVVSNLKGFCLHTVYFM